MLSFRAAPDFERPLDVAGTAPANAAGNNEYLVVVRATSGAGDRELTADLTISMAVTDEEEPPEARARPAVTAAPATGLTVEWTAPATAGGPPVTGYEVEYRAGDTGAFSGWPHAGTALSAALTGLSPSTRYEVRVRARTGATRGARRWRRRCGSARR